VLLHHANCAFADFGRILRGDLLALHGFILSRVESSSKPGAVQNAPTPCGCSKVVQSSLNS
jgi:hypothetical protein